MGLVSPDQMVYSNTLTYLGRMEARTGKGNHLHHGSVAEAAINAVCGVNTH